MSYILFALPAEFETIQKPVSEAKSQNKQEIMREDLFLYGVFNALGVTANHSFTVHDSDNSA